MGRRLVLLNALPVNIFTPYTVVKLTLKKLEPGELKLLKSAVESGQFSEIKCYIRHPSTVKVVSQMLGVELSPSTGLYSYQSGDAIIVAVLKRPPRGQEVEARPEDLELWQVIVEEVV